ncbi:MAG TPA: hypothetical protein VM598_14120 [Bdellovibrionota bacterium]|nr:hypothetical protein [Bdellovibrionota bacterium]
MNRALAGALCSLLLACSHGQAPVAPAAVALPALPERLLEACHSFASDGYDPERIARALHGTVETPDLLRGPGFVSAIHHRSPQGDEVAIQFEIEADGRLTLEQLTRRFGPAKMIHESKQSSARLGTPPPPCGALYVAVMLFTPKVMDSSPVVQLLLRRQPDIAMAPRVPGT